jgi:hypothetical protein
MVVHRSPFIKNKLERGCSIIKTASSTIDPLCNLLVAQKAEVYRDKGEDDGDDKEGEEALFVPLYSVRPVLHYALIFLVNFIFAVCALAAGQTAATDVQERKDQQRDDSKGNNQGWESE